MAITTHNVQLTGRIRCFKAALLVLLLLALPNSFGEAFINPRLPTASNRRIAESFASGEVAQGTISKKAAIELGKKELQPLFPFPLDDWQLQSGGEILSGHNVIVSAPTGAGKTVVGEMAMHLALRQSGRAIYTTPLKALSNQKFADFRKMFGRDLVGMATGDISISRNARLRVMTTEVYRNIAWRSSGLEGNSTENPQPTTDELTSNAMVVLDEFHFMGQPGRGGVWEESVITTPSHTQIVALSATLPNADQLAQWMESVTGRRTVMVVAKGGRPVPLRFLFATKKGIYSLFSDPDAGPGAPKGLLGLRGDGIPSRRERKEQKKKGFGEEETKMAIKEGKIPKGLQVNPSLKALTQKRLQKVERDLRQRKAADAMNFNMPDRRRRTRGWEDKEGNRRSGRRMTMSRSEERRQRERMLRKEMRKSVPTLSTLLKGLRKKELLPAIVFIFSRAGCDDAASLVCRQMIGPENPYLETEDDFEEDDDDDEEEEGFTQQKKKRSTRQRGRPQGDEKIFEDAEGRQFRNKQDEDSNADDLMMESVLSAPDSSRELDFEEGTSLDPGNWKFYAIAGLLSYDQIAEVAKRIAAFNDDNPEIAFDDDTAEQFMLGVGSHHAGILPAHKAFVEALYRGGMMKVVFATETLAAGINMPARTTCICNMAKRSDDGSMKLLETSNLLQMAGRAGRRGMDTQGTCVLVSTPFEAEEEAAEILTSEVKPIRSQFAPSYALAINLVARGGGRLDLAKRLIEKSFALWEKRQEAQLRAAVAENKEAVSKLIEASSGGNSWKDLYNAFASVVAEKTVGFDHLKLESHLKMMGDRKMLRTVSKNYSKVLENLDIERSALGFLETKLDESDFLASELGNADADADSQKKMIEDQRARIVALEQSLNDHSFTFVVHEANKLLGSGLKAGNDLGAALAKSRGSLDRPLTSDDIAEFAKSAVMVRNKKKAAKKAIKSSMKADGLDEASRWSVLSRNSSWSDLLALVKMLVVHGCLETSWSFVDDNDDELELATFSVTHAGSNVGRFFMDNSLWKVIGMGGAWDMLGLSNKREESVAEHLASFIAEEDIDEYFHDSGKEEDKIYKPRDDAVDLVANLLNLTASEMAGYVSCIALDSFRKAGDSVVPDISARQQMVIRNVLNLAEQYVNVAKCCGIENPRFELDLSQCQLVTAWADGCSWTEALDMSGMAPGDLVSMFRRVLDALRQLGNLPVANARSEDIDDKDGMYKYPFGIDPQVRQICRAAAGKMKRYPVQDPLPFGIDESEVEDDFDEDEDFDVED